MLNEIRQIGYLSYPKNQLSERIYNDMVKSLKYS